MKRVAAAVSLAGLLALAGCDSRPAQEVKPGETAMVDKADLQVCLLTGTPMTLDDCAKAEATQAATRVGSAALKAPDVMQQGQTAKVYLAIGEKVKPRKPEPPPAPQPQPPPPQQQQTTVPAPEDAASPDGAAKPPPTAALPPEEDAPPTQTPREVLEPAPGELTEYAPVIGSLMSAELVGGDDFEVKALSPAAQPVSKTGPTTWEWQVKALKNGDKTLSVKTLVLMVDSRGQKIPLTPTTQFKVIKVRVGPAYFLELLKSLPAWLDALALVLAAAAGLAAAWWKFRGALRPPKPGGAPPS
jgi:hypothetical protein